MSSALNTTVTASEGTPGFACPIVFRHPAEYHEYQQLLQTTFRALRPITTQLLLLVNQPEKLQPLLVALRELLLELPTEGVEGCWDYAFFPIMVLLDAVVPSRSAASLRERNEEGSEGHVPHVPSSAGAGEFVVAACRSDRVVEALLGALVALLERSQGGQSECFIELHPEKWQGSSPSLGAPSALVAQRSVSVLQHLAPLLQLNREAASEEVHMAVQWCLTAALTPLVATSEQGGAAGAAGSAVLCGEDLAPLAGFLVHSCLEVSEREVLVGQRGSKTLCAAALSSLSAVLRALGSDPDVLAFFLPGVVSGLSKHLHAAGTAAGLSGPSAPPGTAATVQALACLRIAVTSVNSDDVTAAILGPIPFLLPGSGSRSTRSTTGPPPLVALSNVCTAPEALSALQQLSLSSTLALASGQVARTGTESASASALAEGEPAEAEPDASVSGRSQQRRRLRVQRTLEWLEDTSGRLSALLGRVLPPLCSHPRPAVRAELAMTVVSLLDRCGRALASSQPLFLRLLFTLAQDEWQQVAAPCQEWLAWRAPPIRTAAAPAGATSDAKVESSQSGGGDGSGDTGTGGSARHAAELKALEEEFDVFMRGLTADSVLLDQPALELDEHDIYDGLDDGAGERDQDAVVPSPEAAIAPRPPPPPPPPPPLAPTMPSALPGLQCLLAETATSVHLLRAVRGGELQAVVQARCLTTALLVTGPGRVAEWLLLRQAALEDLLSGLFRCFKFDSNAATLILHIRSEAGSYAPAVLAANTPLAVGSQASSATPVVEAAARAQEAAAVALAGGAAAAAELPRMPLGLLYLASQRSYSAVAAVARSLGRLARAADAAAEAQQRPGYGASSALRRLVDELSTYVRRAVMRGEAGSGQRTGLEAQDSNDESLVKDPATASNASVGSQSWQLDAAAVVAVAAEVIIGASNAWTQPLGLPPREELTAQTPPFPVADPGFENILLEFQQELMRPTIVKLPTHNTTWASSVGQAVSPASSSTPLSYEGVVHPEMVAAVQTRRPLTAQVLGENVMLLRVVMEAVGTVARAVGCRFTTQGRMLRTVLVPLLELLGDPSPPVAAAADTALHSICAHCGYGGSLSSLLAANADYLVDALCARLRDLQRYPQTPHLLAALLRRAGVAPQLLPLMAEPLQRTLQGLSPLARHWAAYYTHSYLGVLRELVLGAATEAAAAGKASRQEVAELNRLAAEARDRRLAAAELEVEAATAGQHVDSPEEGLQHKDIQRYFMNRNAATAATAEDYAEEEQQQRVLTLTAAQHEESELRFRRLHAVAVVAGAAADAVTPLLLSAQLSAAMTASEVLCGALAALAVATPAVEAEAAVVEEYGGAEARMRPVRPETPKVLPVVAAAWTPLMAVLRDARTPVVERGVAAVAELVVVAGGAFLARRFQEEAWPVLQKLLTHGSAHTPGLLSLGTDAVRSVPPRRRHLEVGISSNGGNSVIAGEDVAKSLAPAAVARVRLATLRCIEAVCLCRDAGAVVRTLTWSMAQAALPFLGTSQPLQLQEAAQVALLAVAALDPDGVWLILYDTWCNMPPAIAAVVVGSQPAPAPHEGTAQVHHHFRPSSQPQHRQVDRGLSPAAISAAPEAALRAPRRALLPPLPSAARYSGGGLLSPSQPQQWPVTRGVAADCGPRAQNLLDVVAALPAPWYAS